MAGVSPLSNRWSKQVLSNFEQAASTYNSQAQLQRAVAWRLARQCARQPIPAGFWVDLGSGTGLMADALEACNPHQAVLRVDGCPEMLKHHHHSSQTLLWDLNLGVPSWPQLPSLLASSFALHWLINPLERLHEWMAALTPEGWLALALPVQGSFPQWHQAAATAGVSCTALPFPSQASLLDVLSSNNIRHQQLHQFTQQSPEVFQLLKPMRQIGAQASPCPTMGVGNWRHLKQAWPRCQNSGDAQLTWLIQLLLIQR